MFRNFKIVSNVIFGRGCFGQLDDILATKRSNPAVAMVFVVDDVFENSELREQIPLKNKDQLLWVNVDDEPKTSYVDKLTRTVKDRSGPDGFIDAVIGIGGGSTLDLAKAVSLMKLTMKANAGGMMTGQDCGTITLRRIFHRLKFMATAASICCDATDSNPARMISDV